jgi:dipeptidyl aminopeptidase/acylaminoacyl peptidase
MTGILMGLSLLSVGSPVLGEMVASMAPIYTKREDLLPSSLGIPYEQVAFPTSDGLVLRGWFFPSAEEKSPAILYAPATSHDQRSGLSLVLPLHKAGYSVLLFSYRGHGSSDGDRLGFTYGAIERKDIDAAVRYLYEMRGIHRIGAIGHSAGAVSIILSGASNPHIDAIVAASPFASLEEVWETSRPLFFPKPLYQLTFWLSEQRKGFSRNQVRPQDVIDEISPRPILLVHGGQDSRITREQAFRLFTRAKNPKQFWIIKDATHEGVRNPGLDTIMKNIISFFDASLKISITEKQYFFKVD